VFQIFPNFNPFYPIYCTKKQTMSNDFNFIIPNNFFNYLIINFVRRWAAKQHAMRRNGHAVPDGGGLPLLSGGQQHYLPCPGVHPLVGSPVVPGPADGGLPPTTDQWKSPAGDNPIIIIIITRAVI